MTVSIVAEPIQTPAEAKAAARRRAYWVILGTLFTLGLLAGILGGRYVLRDGGDLSSGGLPPAFALGSAIVFLLAMGFGTWAFYRQVDELERHHNMISTAIGGSVLMIGYPIWLVLWKGGWVTEPSHEIVFGVFFLTTMISYIVSKFR